jgi:TolB protein
MAGPYRTVDLRVVDLEGNTGPVFEGSIFGVRWSPEGDRVAFVRSFEDDTASELVVATTGGEELAIHSLADAFIGRSAWSPDGEWIAYTTFRTDFKGNPMDYELWFVPADGGVSKKLFSSPDTIGVPKWSPDGEAILFDVAKDVASDIYVVDLDGGASAMRLVEGRSGEWSPDGDAIAFIASWCGTFDVTVMAGDGTGQTNLTPMLPGLKTDVVWSPEGDRIAFPYYGSDEGRGLYTVGRDGPEPMRVAPVLEAVAWSADGEYIAGGEPAGRGFCY